MQSEITVKEIDGTLNKYYQIFQPLAGKTFVNHYIG